ncbi:MAG: CCA tRNA nucleotidyltransferase [Anaerolineales bacterium]
MRAAAVPVEERADCLELRVGAANLHHAILYTPLVAITRDELIAAFRQRRHELWLVGGAPRDRLLGRPGEDNDYATDALPDEVEAIGRSLGANVTTVGKRYGTIGIYAGGHWNEITTFRGDSYEGGSRWPDVHFGRSIEEDLARRDFTVNALAEDAFSGELLDLHGGRDDLDRGVLRAVGEPGVRFREDPLRILRGMRFASQLDFEVERSTADAMASTVALLTTLSQERITAEVEKLLTGINPARGLDLLRETGALDVLLPELAPMVGCEQNRFHRYDVWGHTLATVAAIEPGDNIRLRRWAALLHDLGKPAVRHVKANGEFGFYRHEVAGAELGDALLDRLKVGKREAGDILLLVRRHMDRPEPADSRAIRRFMKRCDGHWRALVAVKRADNASHTYDDADYHDALQAACERVEADEAAALAAESPLTGDDLVAMFELPPGPWLREIKDRLSALVLDGELKPGDRAGAERVARRMMKGGM